MKRQTKFGIVLAAAAVISVSVASLVCARGWVQQGADWYYADSSNEFVTETIQASGNSKFYLDADGRMVRDYFLEDYNGNAYYFGSNGAMVTNTWVAIDSALVENQDDYVPDNYWYYFQASGKAMKAASGSVKKTTVDGKKYAFNEYGQMCVGWFGTDGKTVNPDDESNPFAGDNVLYYGGGDNDGVLRAGWVTYYDGWDGDDEYMSDYTNLYFYFNTSNNKKEVNKTKKINGRTYAFNEQGIMMSGWDVYEHPDDAGDANIGKVYFSGQDDGHQVKKGWVYAVPAEGIDAKAYNDDEEKYMYFNNSGDIVADQFRKINGKYYVFNTNGIMKTGLVVWANSRTLSTTTTAAGQTVTKAWNSDKFVNTIDKDWATGEEYAKLGRLNFGKDDNGNFKYVFVDTQGVVIRSENVSNVRKGDALKIHLFGDDGARKTGMNTVEFTDDNYTLNTVGASGDKGSGVFSKKYYSLGVLLKASADIRYGIYQTASESSLKRQDGNWYRNLVNGSYLVLTTSGSKQKGNKTAKKDADGNYWMIGAADSSLRGIYTVGIKEDNSLSNFRTKTMVGQPFADGQNDITTQDLIDAGYEELFVSDVAGEYIGGTHEVTDESGNTTQVPNVYWTAHNIQNSSNSYYTCNYVGPCFQSDYSDGSNKWIPFGMLDNAYKSATFRWTTSSDEASKAYEKTPTNDYFLNCYWDVIR
jgi:glucan-binding YG repeat protein